MELNPRMVHINQKSKSHRFANVITKQNGAPGAAFYWREELQLYEFSNFMAII